MNSYYASGDQIGYSHPGLHQAWGNDDALWGGLTALQLTELFDIDRPERIALGSPRSRTRPMLEPSALVSLWKAPLLLRRPQDQLLHLMRRWRLVQHDLAYPFQWSEHISIVHWWRARLELLHGIWCTYIYYYMQVMQSLLMKVFCASSTFFTPVCVWKLWCEPIYNYIVVREARFETMFWIE